MLANDLIQIRVAPGQKNDMRAFANAQNANLSELLLFAFDELTRSGPKIRRAPCCGTIRPLVPVRTVGHRSFPTCEACGAVFSYHRV